MITPVHKPKSSSQLTEVRIAESIAESAAETQQSNEVMVNFDDGELHTVDVSQ